MLFQELANKARGDSAPSIGLLDRPEDACFFDYHLTDAKDLPYATFKLHYRSSWSLQKLNLVPSTVLWLRSPASGAQSKGFEPETGHSGDNIFLPDCTALPNTDVDKPDEAVFDSSTATCSDSASRGDRGQASSYVLKSPLQLLRPFRSVQFLPQPCRGPEDRLLDTYLQRLLPDRPEEEPVARTRRVSEASPAGSATLPITPSLMSYVCDGSFFDEGQIELGQAQAVRFGSITPDKMCGGEGGDRHIQKSADCSVSDYETSPPSTVDSVSERILSPQSYVPTTGSSFEFDLERFSSPPQR